MNTILVNCYRESKETRYDITQVKRCENNLLITKMISISTTLRGNIKRYSFVNTKRELIELENNRVINSKTVLMKEDYFLIDKKSAKEILSIIIPAIADMGWCSFNIDKDLITE